MYLEFFGLREKPFNVTPDPHFLYMSPSHQEAFANLLYGVRERKGFIMMTGEVGTGKTTLLHNLLANLDDDIQTVFVFHTGIEFTDLLEMIHHELGIPVSSVTRAALLQSLNRYLIEQLELGKNVALIIDEAQNLSPEILENLRQLSNLETAKDKLLQIVLVGQPELDEKMALPQLRQLRQRVSVQGVISTLSPSESRSYILHRLGVAGAAEQGRQLFSEDALALLVHASGGVPRQLNLLCDNAFLIAFADDSRKVDSAHARESIRDHGAPTPSSTRRSANVATPERESRERRRPRRSFGFIAGLTLVAAIALLLVGAYYLGSRKQDSGTDLSRSVDPVEMTPSSDRVIETPEEVIPSGIDLADAAPTARPEPEVIPPVQVEKIPEALPASAPAPEPESRPEPEPEIKPEPEPVVISQVTPPASTPEPEPVVNRVPNSPVSRQTPAVPIGVPAEYTGDATQPLTSGQPGLGEEQSGGNSRLDFWRASSIRELQRILDQRPRVTYTVLPGDHFIGLIERATGRKDLMVRDLLERMNSHITDYDHIEPGWVLYLPDFDNDVDPGSVER
jgi:type II secretory pathway predicted ATPase ExeA/outer membrane biosynthesis protein TonB